MKDKNIENKEDNESVKPMFIPPKKEILITTEPILLDGTLNNIVEEVNKLPTGTIPVIIDRENGARKNMDAPARYLVFIEKRPGSSAKARMIVSVGFEPFVNELKKLVPGERISCWFKEAANNKKQGKNPDVYVAVVVKE